MAGDIKLFKDFKEQELYFLEYFYALSPSERLKKLSDLQKRNFKDFLKPKPRQIAIHKFSQNGY